LLKDCRKYATIALFNPQPAMPGDPSAHLNLIFIYLADSAAEAA
jgi:hypothetical protein